MSARPTPPIAPRGQWWPIASDALTRGVPSQRVRRSRYGADGAFPQSADYACAVERPRFESWLDWIDARWPLWFALAAVVGFVWSLLSGPRP